MHLTIHRRIMTTKNNDNGRRIIIVMMLMARTVTEITTMCLLVGEMS